MADQATQPTTPLEGFKSEINAKLDRIDCSARVDEMDGRLTEALDRIAKLSDLPAEVKEQLLAIGQRLDVAEGNIQGLPNATNEDTPLRRSFVNGSKYLKPLQQRAADKRKFPRLEPGDPGMKVPSALMRARGIQRETTVDTDELGQVVTYRTPLVGYQLEATQLVDLIPTVPCNTEQYQWLQEDRISGEGGIHKVQAGAITGGTVSVTALDDVRNIIAGATATVRRTDGAGTLLGYEQLVVQSISSPNVTFTSQIAGNIADNDIWSFETYAGTAEAAQKPYAMVKSSFTSEDMTTIALLMSITRQALRFNSTLEAWIQQKARKSNRRNKSSLLLYGTGSANNQLQGFFTETNRQTYSWSAGQVGDTMADAIYRAALLIPDEGAGLTCVLRRPDWRSMVSAKAVDGHFIHGKMAPIAIVDTPTMKSVGPYICYTEGKLRTGGAFLLANFAEASELAINDNGEFLFGYMNDDFGVNKITARYEEVLLHAILNLQAYVHGTFDAMPTP
jgi:hypothetical protein